MLQLSKQSSISVRIDIKINGVEYRDHKCRNIEKIIGKHEKGLQEKANQKKLYDFWLGKSFLARTQKH